MAITDGQVVTLEYTVRFSDGEVLDATGDCGPISVMYGSGQLYPAIEDRIADMNVGETREFSVAAEDAFGPHDPNKVRRLPRSRMPSELELEPGATYRLKAEDGHAIRFRLLAIEGDDVVADFNGPHAGRSLEATVTIVDVREATPEEDRRGRV